LQICCSTSGPISVSRMPDRKASVFCRREANSSALDFPVLIISSRRWIVEDLSGFVRSKIS
jgi:hypothetical protein